MASVPLDAETFGGYDAVVVATAHDFFRNPALYRSTRLVVDTRNAVPRDAARGSSRPDRTPSRGHADGVG